MKTMILRGVLRLIAIMPGDKIEDLTMDETDGGVVEFYVENPFVKIKDE